MEKKENSLVHVKDLPNLHNAEESQRELSSQYWTPEKEGEYKVGIIIDIQEETYTDDISGETIKLPCVIMLSQETDGSFNTIRNGSKRLVATIESAIESGELEAFVDAVKITYVGKQKNKSNAFMSDRWSVRKLNIAK